ncbi:hypothetical protein D7X33_34140, partial [Butyricicoccus sp. 1XD8-22]
NDEECSLFFRWSDFQYAQIEKMKIKPIYTREGLAYSSMVRILKRRFKQVRKVIPDFSYDESLIHEDKKSISFLHNGSGLYNILPIPPSWKMDEREKHFMDLIQKGMNNNFLEEGQSWEMLENLFPKLSR